MAPYDASEDVPPRARAGLAHHNVNVFKYVKPFRKRADKTENPTLVREVGGALEHDQTCGDNMECCAFVQDTWVRRVFLVSQDAFPTTHRRSLCVRRVEVSLHMCVCVRAREPL